MDQKEILNILSKGENHTTEFKKSQTSITKDVYESVCAFSNRDGGHIFLGVKDNGEILGIEPNCVEQIKKDFVTAINNSNKMYPPLFLSPREYKIEGRIILHIYVPVGTQVSRCSGRIYDRNNESDIDITNNEELVYKLYARKQETYFVNRVFPEWGLDVLRTDLIDKARKMTRVRSDNHPWQSMDDEELLRSAGLILMDRESQKEGITLAAILLFGKDTTIMSALPQHKTDMIFRVENLDRYDDRDVIVTNLLDMYERLRTVIGHMVMEIWIGIHFNHFRKILLFQRCLEKSGLQTNLDQECEILTNIRKCILGEFRNLWRVTYFAQLSR